MVGIPSGGVNAVITECGAKKVPYAVVLSGGFRESGRQGAVLQDELTAIAAQGRTRIVGPNCRDSPTYTRACTRRSAASRGLPGFAPGRSRSSRRAAASATASRLPARTPASAFAT